MVRRAAILSVLLVLSVPGTAAADSARFAAVDVPAADLADATGAVRMSAAGGHVVFSQAVGNGIYRLVDWSAAGGVRTLAAGTRTGAFDADAGLDGDGRPVVVFSTCRAGNGPGRGPLFSCALRILRLDRSNARPTPLRLRDDHGLSLTTPSMHGQAVAAVAAPGPTSGNVRILYWRTPRSRPRRLSGGTSRCPGCEGTLSTAVDALDLGRRAVAFVWEFDPPEVGLDTQRELRTAPLSGGHSRQAEGAFGYATSTSPSCCHGTSPCEYRRPESPNALADGGVGFVLAQSPCAADETTIVRWADDAADFQGARPNGTLVGGAAWDTTRVYWLSCAPRHDPYVNADVISDACRLVVSSAVPFGPPTLGAQG
jgi:hypothetical protein